MQDHVLSEVGRDGIGPFERHDRQFREEYPDLDRQIVSRDPEPEDRQPPDAEPEQYDGKCLRQGRAIRPGGGCCPGAPAGPAAHHEAGERGRQDDQGERNRQKENPGKRRCGDQAIGQAVQGACGYLQHRHERDHDDRRLDADEKCADKTDIAPERIPDGQGEHDRGARKDEEHSGKKAARGTVQFPSGIGGKLHRLGSGQHHAETQGIHEFLLAQPPPFVDKLVVHQRDLSCRAPE